VWYIKSLPEPEVSAPVTLPDWVSGVVSVPGVGLCASDYSGALHLYATSTPFDLATFPPQETASLQIHRMPIKSLDISGENWVTASKDRRLMYGSITETSQLACSHETTLTSSVQAVCFNPTGD
jgi:hypothetical protein